MMMMMMMNEITFLPLTRFYTYWLQQCVFQRWHSKFIHQGISIFEYCTFLASALNVIDQIWRHYPEGEWLMDFFGRQSPETHAKKKTFRNAGALYHVSCGFEFAQTKNVSCMLTMTTWKLTLNDMPVVLLFVHFDLSLGLMAHYGTHTNCHMKHLVKLWVWWNNSGWEEKGHTYFDFDSFGIFFPNRDGSSLITQMHNKQVRDTSARNCEKSGSSVASWLSRPVFPSQV